MAKETYIWQKRPIYGKRDLKALVIFADLLELLDETLAICGLSDNDSPVVILCVWCVCVCVCARARVCVCVQ